MSLWRQSDMKETDSKKILFQIFYTLLVPIMALVGADFKKQYCQPRRVNITHQHPRKIVGFRSLGFLENMLVQLQFTFANILPEPHTP